MRLPDILKRTSWKKIITSQKVISVSILACIYVLHILCVPHDHLDKQTSFHVQERNPLNAVSSRGDWTSSMGSAPSPRAIYASGQGPSIHENLTISLYTGMAHHPVQEYGFHQPVTTKNCHTCYNSRLTGPINPQLFQSGIGLPLKHFPTNNNFLQMCVCCVWYSLFT